MNTDAWLQLLLAAGTGHGPWLGALRAVTDIDALLGMDQRSLSSLGLRQQHIERLRRCRNPPQSWRTWLDGPENRLIGFGCEDYPERLAEIADAPLALWATGARPELLVGPQLAIVGSRHPTAGGARLAEDMARALSRSGLTITSGLALGIDAASHRGALEGEGGTVAVLGNGIDRIYPDRHRKLGEAIRDHGIIVSEYGPDVPPRPWQFPERNRIIAALGLGVLVVEANRRSGSLITARLANEYGREVFAIPGSVHNTLSKGCHKLIQDGAKLVQETFDVVAEIAPHLTAALEQNGGRTRADDLELMPAALGDSLDFAPTTFDALLESSGLTAAELSSMLLHLELQGTIEALPGGRYCRLIKRA